MGAAKIHGMTLACWLLLAAVVPAQSERTPVEVREVSEPSADPALVAEVQRQLSASDLAVVAQGAYSAAEHRLGDTVPALRAALAKVRGQASSEEAYCANALLDALVLTHADVPPEEAAPFWSWSGAALVLLAENPKRSAPVLLEYFSSRGRGDDELVSMEWIAAVGLLAKARTPGLVGALFEHLQLELIVDVRDEGGRWSGSAGRGGAFGSAIVPAGFPPVAAYLLTDTASVGSTPLVDGPYPVFWSRCVKTEGRLCIPGVRRPQDDVRLAWLAKLAGIEQGKLGLAAHTRSDVTWVDERDLLDRVAGARTSLEEQWLGLRGKLAQRRLLDRDDARGATPCVRVLVRDDRASPDPPLPEIAGVDVQPRKR